MRLLTIGLASAVMLAAGAVAVPDRAEAGRSVGIYTPYFSFYVGPRYKKRYYRKRYYGKRYYYNKRYRRGYGKRYYYGRSPRYRYRYDNPQYW